MSTLTSKNDHDKLKIRYRATDGVVHLYNVDKFDSCSSMAVYKVPSAYSIAIDGSCSSQGGQIFTKIYQWDSSFGNWCLRREVTGEKPYLNSGEVASKEYVSRVEGCFAPGDLRPPRYTPSTQSRKAVISQLRYFRTIIKDEAAIKEFIRLFPFYSVAELVPYIDVNTVQEVNDIAFYLSKYDRSYEAIPLLERIVREFPERIVAKLNLADAYWTNGFESKAIPLYVAYEAKMNPLGLTKNIPSRVKNRQAAKEN